MPRLIMFAAEDADKLLDLVKKWLETEEGKNSRNLVGTLEAAADGNLCLLVRYELAMAIA